MHERYPRSVPLLSIALLAAAGCNEAKSVGLVRPQDRVRPLTPATRSALAQNGAQCTPNATGPVLCTWSGGGATCEITFDTNDTMTHLRCEIDSLTWECTRPGSIYVCSWSDDPSCGDVYALDGSFEAYLCGADLQDRINQSRDGGAPHDAGIPPHDAGSPLDAGLAHDAGSAADAGNVCEALDEAGCMAAPPICEAQYCPGCGGVGVFQRCALAGDPPPPCLPPMCADCTQLDQAGCEADPSCHGVYVDPQTCGCSGIGCCTMFQRCESGGTVDCAGLDLGCRQAEPYCEGPYVVSYVGNCYEGCALETSCDPPPVRCGGQTETFPAFPDACTTNADCAAGIRQQNCCGTDRGIGIHVAEVNRFDRAKALCEPQYPECGCADLGIELDDGSFVPDETQVGVSCQAGVCRTFAVP